MDILLILLNKIYNELARRRKRALLSFLVGRRKMWLII